MLPLYSRPNKPRGFCPIDAMLRDIDKGLHTISGGCAGRKESWNLAAASKHIRRVTALGVLPLIYLLPTLDSTSFFEILLDVE